MKYSVMCNDLSRAPLWKIFRFFEPFEETRKFYGNGASTANKTNNIALESVILPIGVNEIGGTAR